LSGTAKRLMDLAEAHIRNGGYTGFSFRNLAAEVGIKSASVHHHFPTKVKMAAAVIRPNAAELLARAEAWRPWRAYAAQHLWAASPTASEKAA
jgi:TetR/AcrR family transcriptional regulator, transcriptional repressor for nem operon